MLSQSFIVLLCVDAAWVAYGLIRRRNMWRYIVLYWVLLTLKNLCDLMRW